MTAEQKAKAAERKRRWAEKNREKRAQYKRTHYAANRDKYLAIERDRSYRKLYGITTADYDEMFRSQGGKCAICLTTQSIKAGKTQAFAVDHCHTTGVVRGLLCLACNHLLGRYERHADAIGAYLGRALLKKAA